VPAFSPLSRSALALTSALLLGLSSSAPAAPTRKAESNTALKASKAEAEDRKADLAELRSKIENVRRDLASEEGKRADVADQLKDTERAISTLSRDLRQLSDQRGDLQDTIKQLLSQSRDLEGTLGRQQSQLEALILRQYRQGRPDSLHLLLNGDDPNQIARDLYYLGEIGRARASLMQAIKDTLQQKKTLADATRSREAELAALEAKQKEQHQKLAEQRKQRQATVDKLSEKISNRKKELGTLQRDQQRMTRLIEELSRVIAARQAKAAQAERERLAAQQRAQSRSHGSEPKSERTDKESKDSRSAPELRNDQAPDPATAGNFAQNKGSLRLPVRGNVSNRFGAPRDGGGSWKGLFIRAGNGSEVKAIAPGRVVFADWMRGFGNLLIIDHGGSYLSIYGNNEAVIKHVGDAVKAGETVAQVGNSGGNPESGLYFELRYQGQPQDPLKWVSLR
jgi:septal ring factor EnvC (AmiA/AmiB activator)